MRIVQDAQSQPENANSGEKSQWGALLILLQGRKTYATLIITAILLAGQYIHFWTLPDEVFKGLQILALAFIKAGVARETKQQKEITQ
jgi:hypothetical protein